MTAANCYLAVRPSAGLALFDWLWSARSLLGLAASLTHRMQISNSGIQVPEGKAKAASAYGDACLARARTPPSLSRAAAQEEDARRLQARVPIVLVCLLNYLPSAALSSASRLRALPALPRCDLWRQTGTVKRNKT